MTDSGQICQLCSGYSLNDWTIAYYFGQTIIAFIVFAGLVFTSRNLSIARKNLVHFENTNKENNNIQREYVLQARLIELSNEWNSQGFVAARNWAALTIDEFEGKDGSIRSALRTRKRMNEWIHISMVAHFFVRLSHIQRSKQINFHYAKREFKEPIAYWLIPLLKAYKGEKDEERLRHAIIAIHNIYNWENPYQPEGVVRVRLRR